MTKVLIVVNAVLLFAVGFLFYAHYSEKKQVTARVAVPPGRDSILNKKVLFAYIDLDSIQEKYELAKTVQREIKSKEASISTELDRMGKGYQSKLSEYQQKAASMTEEQANAARRDLENAQNQMIEKRQLLTDEYNQFALNKNMVLKKKIENFLKEFNADQTYSFIFSYEPGLFYYKDTSYDITRQVLKGLNEQLKKDSK